MNPTQINLYDYTGKLVSTNENKSELNIENLKPGFYFVTVQFENGISATKKVEIN